MASVKGRSTNFNRFKGSRIIMEARDLRRASADPNDRVYKLPPRKSLELAQQACLFDCLSDPRIQDRTTRTFGIVWRPDVEWANGPSIRPFSHIFDRFVEGHWRVSVVDDIDGIGNPGWLFERL